MLEDFSQSFSPTSFNKQAQLRDHIELLRILSCWVMKNSKDGNYNLSGKSDPLLDCPPEEIVFSSIWLVTFLLSVYSYCLVSHHIPTSTKSLALLSPWPPHSIRRLIPGPHKPGNSPGWASPVPSTSPHRGSNVLDPYNLIGPPLDRTNCSATFLFLNYGVQNLVMLRLQD